MTDPAMPMREAPVTARAGGRAGAARRHSGPSLGRCCGQIGVRAGRGLDGWPGAGVTTTGALTAADAAPGLGLAVRWVHRP